MNKRLIVPLLCAGLCLQASAQRVQRTKVSSAVQAYADSLAQLRTDFNTSLRLWDDIYAPAPPVRLSGDCYRLFVPTTYYESVPAQAFQFEWSPEAYDRAWGKVDSVRMARPQKVDSLACPVAMSTRKADRDRSIKGMLMNYYLQHPSQVKGNELNYADLKVLDDKAQKDTRVARVKNYMETDAPVKKKQVDEENELVVQKPNFWTHKGNGYLQFSQNHISDNWYKGGESTNSLLSGLVLEANYDDQQRLEFENKFEAKLGFITAPSDTVHSYKTNADLLRITSKLGVKAFKNWYYTFSAEFKTQFFANYTTNTDNLISNFLSPMELDVTLGMDYKLNKKNLTLSLLTSPLAYSYIGINDHNIVDPTSFNVEAGKYSANLFGSKFVGNMAWTIVKNVKWESKLEYFTTYETAIANWENTFDFALSRYLSTKVFVHVRYDDGVAISDANTSHFQLQEMLTFGLNYTW
jgi:hypothetical protein